MEKFLLSILFSFFLVASFSQAKNDNAIAIPAKALSEEKISLVLVSSGYPLDKVSKSYFLTQPVTKIGSTSIKLSVYLKDSSTYILTGWYNTNITLYGVSLGFEQISFKGMKGSVAKNSWEELIKVAVKLSQEMTFIRQ